MSQLLLLSIVIATFAVPACFLRWGGCPGYGTLLGTFLGGVAVYVLLLLFVYPRLL